jgi:DNA-directed RNA polymerase specialized sigma24 family protein
MESPFEQLYRQHRRDVYGAVLRDVRDPDEAEDVTQIAFLNA